MICILHLLWIIPLSMLGGFAMTAYLYIMKNGRYEQDTEITNWDDFYFDEVWED